MKARILAIEKLSKTSAQGYADLCGDKYVRFFVDKKQMKIGALNRNGWPVWVGIRTLSLNYPSFR